MKNNSCFDCQYCKSQNGAMVCTKISEILLGTKVCGEFVHRISYDTPHCPTCGKAVIDKAHAIHECITEEL